MAEAQETKKFEMGKAIHIAIGLFIMFAGYFFSSPEFLVTPSEKLAAMNFPQIGDKIAVSLSPVGMIVLCTFLGVIYLWTFVNTQWPGFLGILLLGVSSYAPMNAVLSSFLGNPMVVLIFFVMVFAAALVRSQVAVYIARWLMTRPIVEGRPWVLVTMIFITTYCVAFFEQTTAVFLMWPVAYTIFKEVGAKKGDKMVSFIIVGIIMMALLSFATDAIKGGAFYLVASLYTLGEIGGQPVQPMNLVLYLLLGFLLSLIILTLILLTMRFVYKADISALKKFDLEALKRNPLPPMNMNQKFCLFLFGLYALILILAGVLPPNTALGGFLKANQNGASIFIVFLLAITSFKGEPMLDYPKVMSSYAWTVFFLIATAMLFGGALTHPSTNFAVVAESVLKETFAGVSYFMLIAGLVIIAIVITNFTNSVVSGLIFAPVIIALCNGYGVAYLPVLACFYFTVLIAACTPAASPFAALLFGNKEWISAGDAAHYAIVMSLICVAVVLVIGAPLAIMLF